MYYLVATATNLQIKNVDKSAVEASTYEGKLVFHDLRLEEGVSPLLKRLIAGPRSTWIAS
jgi:hypothetical protein